MRKLSKLLGLSMLVMASLCTVSSNTYAGIDTSSKINLVINEVPITNGVLPMLVEGRTLAPIRVISETLGAKVDFDAATKKVTITKGLTKIEMTINKPQVKVNGVTQVIDTVPIIKNGSTMLPLRFIGEVLECDVQWDSKTHTVIVRSDDAPPVNINNKVDKWGRKIRTTNLPKNASLFPYVVEGVPNWVYESIRINKPTPQWETDATYHTVKTAKQLWESNSFDYDWWIESLELDLNTRLNIDYRTINKEAFALTMDQLYTPSSAPKEFGTIMKAAEAHVDFYKQHKVISKAEVTVLPETFWMGAYDQPKVNAYVKLTVVQQPAKSTGLMYDDFGVMTGPAKKSTRPTENKVYEGVVQLDLLGTPGNYSINYNTAAVMCQLDNLNVFGGSKPANGATLKK